MKRIHSILTGLSLTIIALSINRLTDLTQTHLQPYDYLRWLDFNAMLPIPLVSIILYYLLKREIVYDHSFLKTTQYTILSIVLISGIYLFGAGSGDHELTNYLNFRFCQSGTVQSPICNIIRYNDDVFSHYIYYVGFILMNVSLMLIEYKLPRKSKVSNRDLFFLSLNGLCIALGVFANLAFEEIGIDLLVFASVMVLSLLLLFYRGNRTRNLPVTYYFAFSYTVGVFSTGLYKLLMSVSFGAT